jgi:hypothetical protein
MDKKTPQKNNWNIFTGFLTPEEKIKASLYSVGCMGAIVFVTFLVRWVVGIFKGF